MILTGEKKNYTRIRITNYFEVGDMSRIYNCYSIVLLKKDAFANRKSSLKVRSAQCIQS